MLNKMTQVAGGSTACDPRPLKILTLGHSLAVNSCQQLALIAAKEGYGPLQVGTLYYSGCMLSQHVDYLTRDAAEYYLYRSSTETPELPPKITKGVTMKEAIEADDWDIFIMQGGCFEPAKEGAYQNGNIQTIQSYVNRYKRNPNAIFAWHMAWVGPVDRDLRDRYPFQPNWYYKEYQPFNDNRAAFYQAVTRCVERYILTDDTFRFLIPSGTAMENALSSWLEEKDLHRDYIHATDLGCTIAAYTWLCCLAGIEKLEEIKLDKIPKAFFNSTKSEFDLLLTEAQKAIILESVNNALAAPLKMTQSRFTAKTE